MNFHYVAHFKRDILGGLVIAALTNDGRGTRKEEEAVCFFLFSFSLFTAFFIGRLVPAPVFHTGNTFEMVPVKDWVFPLLFLTAVIL